MVIPYLDPVDNRWRIAGFESYSFSSEDDAREAGQLSIAFASDQLYQESLRRAMASKAKVAA